MLKAERAMRTDCFFRKKIVRKSKENYNQKIILLKLKQESRICQKLFMNYLQVDNRPNYQKIKLPW